ncbi:MAG: MBL fold metallo-hydrolase [Acidimicrobiia bacterium]|nr:MBL fold metallo-hydrolase [Acidimicrobiia bacterium]
MSTNDPVTTQPAAPTAEPQRIAPDTWLVPNLVPSGPGQFLFVNTMVILAEEPVVVDTGAPLHREQWLDAVTSLVDPEDVRWVFLSHDDGDHIGNMAALLDRAPNATVVANFFSAERASLEPDRALPLDRMVWLEEGSSFDAGDRRLHLMRPPIFDGPTTRGLYDERTGVMWAADSFGAFTTGAVYDAADLPPDLYDESFRLINSLVSPWHQWLDAGVYGRHVDRVEALGATTIASGHGPVLRGPFIAGAFDRVRAMAGQPIVPPPGQEVLDELVAQLLAGTVPAT